MNKYVKKLVEKFELSIENQLKEIDFHKFFSPILELGLIDNSEVQEVLTELDNLGFIKTSSGRLTWSEGMVEFDKEINLVLLPKLAKKFPEYVYEVVTSSGKIGYEFYNKSGDAIAYSPNYTNMTERRKRAELKKKAEKLTKGRLSS